jgi:hypothetical protein
VLHPALDLIWVPNRSKQTCKPFSYFDLFLDLQFNLLRYKESLLIAYFRDHTHTPLFIASLLMKKLWIHMVNLGLLYDTDGADCFSYQ